MSSLSGGRWSRASPRARGSVRGSARGGVRGKPAPVQSRQSVVSSASQEGRRPQVYRKLSPTPREQHNKASNRNGNVSHQDGAQLSSAILSHAGPTTMPKDQPWRNAAGQDKNSYKQRMSDLYQKLKERRERERKQAIKDGFLADPDKPRSLANAITPVGTCQDMCPEFERVERIVQLMVDSNEKIPSTLDVGTKVPCEDLMVKRFRRSAAGYDEQLPSDIRPPRILQKTLNHLFETVIGGPEPLANTHKFVWDRTRGIRNDFSIQQVTKVEDLKIAIDCFERIARFHILSLHQLSHPSRDNGEFDHHQEREQLNNTLLSLMYYYEDSRGTLVSPHEAEFRAYCILFEIQDQRPDLEDRAQNWPSTILKDPQVKTALRLYAAAGNTSDEQGPLRPRTTFATAQANTRGFFELVQSNSVSYIMACVAEIYFNLVRSSALETIWTAYRKKRPGSTASEDWSMEDLTYALGLDDHDQTRVFCEEHGLDTTQEEHGEEVLVLGSFAGRSLIDHNPRRKQLFSKYMVENKRLGRSFPAVINGLTFSEAQAQGLVNASESDSPPSFIHESLFINEDSGGGADWQRSRSKSPISKPPPNISELEKSNDRKNPFSSVSNNIKPSDKPNPFSATMSNTSSQPVSAFPAHFDNLNGGTDPFSTISDNSTSSDKPNPFAPATSNMSSQTVSAFPANPGPSTITQSFNPFAPKEPLTFDFSAPSNQKRTFTTSTPSLFGSTELPKFDFRLNAGSKKSDDPNAGGQSTTDGPATPAASASTTFGKPSVNFPTGTTPESASTPGSSNKPSTPPFVFGSNSFTPKSRNTELFSNPDQSKVGLNARKDPTAESIAKLSNHTAVTSELTHETPALTAKSSEATPKLPSIFSPPVQSLPGVSLKDDQSLFSKNASSLESSTSHPSFNFSSPDTTSSSTNPPIFKTALPGQTEVPSSTPKLFSDLSSNPPTTKTTPAFDFLNPNTSTTKVTPAFNFSAPNAATSPVPTTQKQDIPKSPAKNSSSSSSFIPPPLLNSTPKLLRTAESSSTTRPSYISNHSPGSVLSQSKFLAPAAPLPNPLPPALDKVTEGLVFDDNGLLQQYIEISIVPILNSAIAQFEDEESWKVARESRFVLLSRKYLRKWKELAWNLGVIRRGRKRRQNFARSIQDLAKSTKDREQELSRSSIFNVSRSEKIDQKPMAHARGPSALSARKRQSLPAGPKGEIRDALETPRIAKRKLEETESFDKGKRIQQHISSHKRSNTIGYPLDPNIGTSTPQRLSLRSKILNNDELANPSNISTPRSNGTETQARLFAPNTYSDTTRTDYFRLKALGVNPDTPIAPVTRKPAISSEARRSSFYTPHRDIRVNHIKSPTTKQKGNDEPTKKLHASPSKDNDDEFFASIRAIRSTLADSTAWFQSERQSIELSMTPSKASVSPSPSDKKETPAERKLREIRERGHTPSRSEVRLRAMGDRSLLPVSFWDGEGHQGSSPGKYKGKRKSDGREGEEEGFRAPKRREMVPENGDMGFAALTNPQSPQNGAINFAEFGNGWPNSGMVNSFGQFVNGQDEHFQQSNGGNIDEIIELSD